MSEQKQKRQTRVTPKGVAMHPYLQRPDTKFNSDGTFKVKMRFPQSEVAELTKEFEKMAKELRDSEMAEAKKEKKGDKVGKLKKATIASPFKPAYDDEGEETDEVVATFSQDRIVKYRDGTQKEKKVAVWDARKNPSKKNPWSGSILKIVYWAKPYYFPPNNEYGVSLKLIGAQIIELVEGGDMTAEAEAALSEEEGFVDEGDDEFGDSASDDGDTSDNDDDNTEDGGEDETGDF